MQQVGKARVRAQAVHPRLDVEQHHPGISVSTGFLQPAERLSLLAQGSVSSSRQLGRNVLAEGQFLQLIEDLDALAPLPDRA
jgi:hypothetical protein